MKATELHVIAALILLVLALVARFITPSGLGLSISWRGADMYFLPVSSASRWRLCCASLPALALDVAVQSHCYMVAFVR